MATPITSSPPAVSQNPPQPGGDPHIATAFDIKRLDQAFLDDPYPTYRALREHDPVHRMPDGSYFLTRYDDLVEVYRDAATWSSDKKVDFKPNFGDSLLYEHHTTSLVFNDPPVHTRVRKLLAPTFSPRSLKALQPRIEALVDRLLDAAAARGSIDMIDDFAAAIPVQLIGDLLGIPDDEREPLRSWSLAILGGLEPVLSSEQFSASTNAVAEFKAYLKDLVARRRRSGVPTEPADIACRRTRTVRRSRRPSFPCRMRPRGPRRCWRTDFPVAPAAASRPHRRGRARPRPTRRADRARPVALRGSARGASGS